MSKVLYASDPQAVRDNGAAILGVARAYKVLCAEMAAAVKKSYPPYIASRSIKVAIEEMEDAIAQLRACVQRDDPLFKYRGDQGAS